MDRVRVSALDWALAHVEKHGDTDLLPIPFEYAFIRKGWGTIRAGLGGVDLHDHSPRPHRQILVPKLVSGFRICTQLDPFDTILFTAMVYEYAGQIESGRIAVSKGIVHSHRLSLTKDGSFYVAKNPWDTFQLTSAKRAARGTQSWVVVADIADCYTNLYHHRLENSLSAARVSKPRVKSIMGFLGALSAGNSRGIPIGPQASALLAEICLDDVDRMLVNEGYRHVRYVDDIRIFCRTAREAYEALHKLVEYLHVSHRLSLQAIKTKVMPLAAFRERHLRPPADRHDKAFKNRMEVLVRSRRFWNPYTEEPPENPEEITSDDVLREREAAATELFGAAVRATPMDVQLCRYFLRAAAGLRVKGLRRQVLWHLDQLAPALRDVVSYLGQTGGLPSSGEERRILVSYLRRGMTSTVPYVALWWVETLAEAKALPARDLHKMARSLPEGFRERAEATVAKHYGQAEWIRAKKETWMNGGHWDRRALISAAALLPDDERGHWLRRVRRAAMDDLERTIVEHMGSA